MLHTDETSLQVLHESGRAAERDYRIDNLRFQAEKRWFWAASLAAMNQHLDAQVADLGQSLFNKLGLNIRAA